MPSGPCTELSCPLQQHQPAAPPEIFEGSAEEEEFLRIKVVEGSCSPRGAARGSLRWAPT